MSGVYHQNILQWLGVALEMEVKGQKFYEKARGTTTNDLGRDVFTMLAEDELVHVERIKFIYDSLRSDKAWTKGWKELAPARPDLVFIFRDLAERHAAQITLDTGDVEALDIGIDFEAKSIKFYSDHLEEAVEESERDFLARMVAEEQTHHRALVDMLFYLENPAGYFRELEKRHVDGGP